jgi:transcriptional regulator with XRE-family HTH domain
MANETTGEAAGRFDWPSALAEHRKRAGLSRPEVARRSGLSASAIKSYETGARRPTREALSAIIDALGLTAQEANPILAGAGYAANWRALFHRMYGPWDADWFTAEVECVSWPAFVTNEGGDIIAANRAMRRLMGMHLNAPLPNREQWNVLVLLSAPSFSDHLENWDEVVRFMIGLGKSDLRVLVNPERPPTWAAEPYRRFLSGDPAYVTRLLQLWEGAEPVSHTTRMHCPVRWRLDDGRLLRFTALMHVADIWQVFAWHDWHPDYPETLKALLESGGQPSA